MYYYPLGSASYHPSKEKKNYVINPTVINV